VENWVGAPGVGKPDKGLGYFNGEWRLKLNTVCGGVFSFFSSASCELEERRQRKKKERERE